MCFVSKSIMVFLNMIFCLLSDMACFVFDSGTCVLLSATFAPRRCAAAWRKPCKLWQRSEGHGRRPNFENKSCLALFDMSCVFPWIFSSLCFPYFGRTIRCVDVWSGLKLHSSVFFKETGMSADVDKVPCLSKLVVGRRRRDKTAVRTDNWRQKKPEAEQKKKASKSVI